MLCITLRGGQISGDHMLSCFLHPLELCLAHSFIFVPGKVPTPVLGGWIWSEPPRPARREPDPKCPWRHLDSQLPALWMPLEFNQDNSSLVKYLGSYARKAVPDPPYHCALVTLFPATTCTGLYLSLVGFSGERQTMKMSLHTGS